MSEKYKPVKGDRVRVVVEGEVTYDGGGYFTLDNGYTDIAYEGPISIEKIEPPVEVFKPGDVVRTKLGQRHQYVIGKDGYFQFSDGNYVISPKRFTSRSYEKVELG